CPADIPILYEQGSYAACFYFAPDGVYKDYDSAKADCISRGGILAEPRSPDVDQFLASHIDSLGLLTVLYFVGANDVAEEGTWRYESDGDLLGYTNWPPGAPDNALSGGVYENCLSYFPALYTGAAWNDVRCNYASLYICQYGPKAPAFGGASCAGSDTALSACDNPACSECSCWASDDCGGATCPIVLAVFVILILAAVVISGVVMFKMTKVKKEEKSKRAGKQVAG
ncbi:hypothetical protein BaRGS_00011643, partial [Batillaria attramentaria]